MAITLNDNIRINAGKPSEAKYLNSSGVPYTGTSQVLSQVALSERHVGLTVNVNNIEYWFATGVTNSSLVIKTAAAGVGTITGGVNGISVAGAGSKLGLGGSLTGNTTITTSTSNRLNIAGWPMQYATNQSANYNSRSLVDSGYVSGGTYMSANNGLTKSPGNRFRLGGSLTGDTSILLGNNNFGFVNTLGPNVAFEPDLLDLSYVGTGGTQGIYLYDNNILIEGSNINVTNTKGILSDVSDNNVVDQTLVTSNYVRNGTFTFTNKTHTSPIINTNITGNVVVGGNITPTNFLVGATANQTISNKRLINSIISSTLISGSSTWLGSSIQPAYGGTGLSALGSALQQLRVNSAGDALEYFTPIIGGITGATNGLKKTLNNRIGLGGALTGNTNIDANNFELNIGNIDLSYFNITSGGVAMATDYVTFQLTDSDGGGAVYTDNQTNPTGIRYAADYSSTFGVRSLVDMGFVTGLTSSFTANNGLTKTGNNFYLGGSLTGVTVFKGANTHSINFGEAGGEELVGVGLYTSGYSEWQLGEDGILGIYNTNSIDGGAAIQVVPYGLLLNGGTAGAAAVEMTNNGFSASSGFGQVTIAGTDSGVPVRLIGQVGGDITSFILTPHAIAPTMVVDTTSSVFAGIQYAANYSANFGARSLVDKAFVTGNTITGATNGLTKVGNKIKLGGTLTGTTIINGGSHNLTFTGIDQYNVDTGGDLLIQSSTRSELKASNYAITLQGDYVGGYAQIGYDVYTYIRTSKDAGEFIINDNRSHPDIGGVSTGIEYADDYSANYTNRSLVDRGWVLSGKTYLQKQTFTADASHAGLNVGSYTATPSSSTDGDMYYDSIASAVRVKTAGVWRNVATSTGVTTVYNQQLQNNKTNVTQRNVINITEGLSAVDDNGKTNIRFGSSSATGNPITGTSSYLNVGNADRAGFLEIRANYHNNSFRGSKLIVNAQPGTTGHLFLVAQSSLGDVGLDFLSAGPNTGATAFVRFRDTRTVKVGLEYDSANYNRAHWTNNTIVDKGYVTGITSTLVSSANNGITKSGTNVRLGGSLTGNTQISGNTGSRLTIAGWPLQYATDMSANYNSRSHVDKGYVTGLTSTLVSSANNGLTKSGTNVRLGGTLTGNTTITTATGSRLTVGGWPMQYAADLSANYGARSLVDKGFVTGLTSNLGAKSFPMGVGASVPITAGQKGIYTIPYSGTIKGWRLVSKESTTMTLDVWKANNSIPTIANTIFGTKPSLSAAQLNSATGLNIAVTAGDVFILNVDSNNLSTYFRLDFEIQ